MLAVNPGEVVQSLHNLVIEDERAVAVVADLAEAEVESCDRGNAPTLRIRRRIWKPQLFNHVALAAQLLRVVVDERYVSEAELVHLGGGQDPRVGEHVL